MKPVEGRARVVIEEVSPEVNAGRYPAKSSLGETVTVTAAIFSDGHDHVAARLLYKPAGARKWNSTPFTALTNDLWTASFLPDKIGDWVFTIEAWVDHFDTWVSDLAKRLAAQAVPLPATDAQSALQLSATVAHQDIPLAFRIGAAHISASASRAKGADAKKLASAAAQLESLAAENRPTYNSPLTPELTELIAKYPDLSFSTKYVREVPLWVDRERARFSAWYELFPRSCSPTPGVHGTLRDVEAYLPEIAAMGFDIVYMPPVHPIGTQFRKGPNNNVNAGPNDEGSPWAIGNNDGGHTAIHAKLGTLEDFDHLQQAARGHRLELALDIAFQCAPDHPWVKAHPSWFTHRPDGTIQYAENPPKKYQDIYPLNFESADWRGLWQALYDVFAFWIARGVRVFRVDNPHTKALPFWEWCITELHKLAPETVFLAEAFTRPHVAYSLAKGGYTQGYTYFTWRNTKRDLVEYFTELSTAPVANFFRPNLWPNTPDILHEQLQVADPTARRSVFMQRAVLAATLSSNWGIYGPAYELCDWQPAKPAPGKTTSEEYLDSEKYEIRTWDRSDPISIAPLISQLNAIRRAHPALQHTANLTFHTAPNDSILAYSKTHGDSTILVVVNLDTTQQQTAWLDLNMPALGLAWQSDFIVEDLLTGATYNWHNQWNYVSLAPAQPAHIFRIAGAQAAHKTS